MSDLNGIRLIFVLISLIPFYSVANNKDKTNLGTDSVIKKLDYRFTGYFATSFIQQINWRGDNNNNWLFNGNIQFFRSCKSINRKSQLDFRSELAYQKFKDSIWYKTSDLTTLNYLKSYGSQKFNIAFTIYFKSQLLNIRSPSGLLSSGFISPGNAVLAIGLNSFSKNNSYINLSLTSLQVRTNLEEPEKEFLYKKIGNYYIRPELGWSLQAYYEKRFNNCFRFDNRTNGIITIINNNKLSLDSFSRLLIKIKKPFELRIENRISFDEFFSTRLQFKNEFLIGLSYNIQKN